MLEVDKLRQEVLGNVLKESNVSRLNHVNTILKQDLIGKWVAKLLVKREIYTDSTYTELYNIILHFSGSVQNKVNLLKKFHAHGVIDMCKLVYEGKHNSLDDVITLVDKARIRDLANDIVNWTPNIRNGSLGKGEAFLILLGDCIYKGATGDIELLGEEVEVKAARGRMTSTVGYSAPVAVFNSYFLTSLSLKSDETLTDPNAYNFTKSGLIRLSELYSSINDNKWVHKHLSKTFKLLYYKAPGDMIKKFVDDVVCNSTFDVARFIERFYMFQFSYYKYIDKWDGILFINPDNYNMLYITSENMLKSKLDLFKQDLGFSWKQDRCSTYQLTLR